MNRFTRTLLTTLLLVTLNAAPAGATSFSQLIILGDSLSDTGNIAALTGGSVPLSPPYAPGRFSNGSVWVETLSSMLGLGAVTPSVLGGTNFAWGGAVTGVNPDIPPIPPGMTTEVGTYLSIAGGLTDPDALHVIWGGGNNVRNNASAASASDIAGIVSQLAAAGGTHFLVPNLPDIGLTPEALFGLTPGCAADPGGCSALMSGLTQQHNAALESEMAALSAADPSLNIILLDVFGLFNDLLTSGPFAVTNLPCYSGSPFDMIPAPVCGNPDDYVFWDAIHPTAAAHAILGDFAFQAVQPIPIPAAAWLFGSALLGLAGMRRRRAA